MKKPTLQIKAFTGVDRQSDGTVTPDNKFFSLKNWHPKSLGELEAIKGVVKNNASALPGVDEIIHVAFHKNTGEDTKLLAFFKPSITGASDFGQGTVSASNFDIPGTGVGHDFLVTFTGVGGLYKTEEIIAIDGDGSITDEVTFTTPVTGIPDWVCQINIYYRKASGFDELNGVFCGSLHRRSGVFPSELNFFVPLVGLNGDVAPQIVPQYINIQNTTGSGQLVSGKTYYIGICPNTMPQEDGDFGHSQPYSRIRMYDTENGILSVTIPDNATRATVRIYFADTLTGATALKSDNLTVSRVYCFLGQAPEDVLLSSRISGDAIGAYASLPLQGGSLNLASASATYDDTSDTIYVPGLAFQDLTPVLFTGTNVAGLVNDTVYWVSTVDADLFRLATSLANLRAGSFVNITATGSFTDQFLSQIYVDYNVDHLAYNSNNGVNMSKSYLKGTLPVSVNVRALGGTNQVADGNRYDGVFINGVLAPFITAAGKLRLYLQGTDFLDYPLGTAAADNIGCWVFDSLDMDPTDGYQLLANIAEKNFSITGQAKVNTPVTGSTVDYSPTNSFLTAPDISPSLFWQPSDNIMTSVQFTIRTYLANGDNCIFSTDGYTFKPIVRDAAKARIPTCKYISSFVSRLVACGGDASFQNAPNQLFYSESDNPFDWGASGNSINVFSARDFNGLGAYSQNLIDSGFASFLVISKEDSLFTWDGNTGSGATQLYYSFGFAGPRAFAITEAGPLFVSREGVYLLAGDKIVPMADELKPVFLALTEAQLSKVIAIYQDEKYKIAYSSAGTSVLDTEWWIETSTFQNKPIKYISGPHSTQSFASQASTIGFGGQRDVRISALNGNIYQMDSGTSNAGAAIARQIVLSGLGLQEDHRWKLLEEIYLAVKLAANETFDVQLDVEDGGTLQYTGSLAGTFSVADRQLLQHFVSSRILGRVNKLTIDNSSVNALSLFDVSLIFSPKQRRLFR